MKYTFSPDVLALNPGIEQLEKTAKRNKYGATRCEWKGVKFDSKAEMERYLELSLLQLAGQITHLELQPMYVLTGGVKYRGDFQYIEQGKMIVEDVKGGTATMTPLFRVKWKQVQELYPNIEFRLVQR